MVSHHQTQITDILLFMLIVCLGQSCKSQLGPREQPPNIVIIFADDMGYGDLGVYGHPSIRTPNLDRMATEGMKFTQFYTAASVCTPSRAALLTGRLPIRSGMCSDSRRVLFPDSKLGIPQEEITIAEALKGRDYISACIGKWHLGHNEEFLPTRHGFDYYFGIPYSNDMDFIGNTPWFDACKDAHYEDFNVPLLRNEEIVERPADQRTITKRYTEDAVQFIRSHSEDPFFLYLSHSLPHVPLFASEDFLGKSARGLYGDVIEEIDWSVGQILKTVTEEGLEGRTLVFFTSDNGPWLYFDTHGGSAGLLRGGKGMTWEGGMRVPGLAWWPGVIEAGTVNDEIGSTMDLFPTAIEIARGNLPIDRLIDGRSLVQDFNQNFERIEEPHYFYYRGETLYAVRMGSFKAHFITEWAYLKDNDRTIHDPPLLFDLEKDPSEAHNINAQYPEIIEAILRIVDKHRSEMVKRPTQLNARIE